MRSGVVSGAGVVYNVPCSVCDKSYIGETVSMQTWGQDQRAQGCLHEMGYGEVSYCRACMGGRSSRGVG